MNEFRAISLWQPWAGAVAAGLKRFETRSWPTSYRGPLLICAAKRWGGDQIAIRSTIANRLLEIPEVGDDARRMFLGWSSVLGAIVAVADVVECWPTDGTPTLSGFGLLDITTEAERLFGDFHGGRFAWQLENVIRLDEPIPCSGKQGLWTPSADIVDAAKDRLRGVTA